ncbi:MAG: immunoglobulin-like domain-containing protein [Lachnotalea sp.]
MIMAIIIDTSFLIGFIVFRKVEVINYTPSSKVLLPFYKISIYLVEHMYKKKSKKLLPYFVRAQVVDDLKKINPTDRSQKHIKTYYIDKLAMSLMVIFAGSILSIIVIVSQNNEKIITNNNYLQRGSYSQGKKSEKLEFSVEEEVLDQEIVFQVDEQQLTQTEVFNMFREAQEQMDATILGDNSSFMEIRSNMNLPTRITGKPLQITWNTDKFEVLSNDGEVKNEELDENGINVNLTATYTYKSYSEENIIQVKVLPPILSNAEIITKNLLDKIQIANQDTITQEYISLPQNINGKLIVWGENKSKTGKFVVLLGIITAVVIYYGKDNELKKEVKKRNQQLLSDYPDIVSKLTLLLGAGMTVKGAWKKIALDYREKKYLDSKYFRYAYEEMLITYYEIIGGVSELKAYEDFGKRSKNQRYMKLSALITQNLRKGSRGLSQILESESLDAFEDRKAYAKTIGEEAGTKLMIPMFLNLMLVLVIIMIPACMSFQM